MIRRNWIFLGVLLAVASVLAAAQLSSDELKKLLPAGYYFAGQSASVQTRNSGGLKTAGGKYVLVSLVDNSGYSTGIKEKYQGLFITETKVTFEGATLDPGQYGFGFKDDKFIVMNVAATDVVTIPSKNDDQLKHPVPLKLEKDGEGYRLYAGKKYVTLKAD